MAQNIAPILALGAAAFFLMRKKEDTAGALLKPNLYQYGPGDGPTAAESQRGYPILAMITSTPGITPAAVAHHYASTIDANPNIMFVVGDPAILTAWLDLEVAPNRAIVMGLTSAEQGLSNVEANARTAAEAWAFMDEHVVATIEWINTYVQTRQAVLPGSGTPTGIRVADLFS